MQRPDHIREADAATADDSVITFNYDTLVERALAEAGKDWSHRFSDSEAGMAVHKLHGSIDWIVAHRSEQFSKLELLFDKGNANRLSQITGHAEDDFRLWRCRTRNQLREWVSGRDLQLIPSGGSARTVGIAGLGAYKQLHQIPGLGPIPLN
ncbi:MAG: SIR2 family protein [Pirellulaceae bacterium]